ncbi:DUF6526 family protein [Falsibacillus albus]|uniref:Uncharacterized protein n=1 Tax=Falsibacillus albus TaxID=2478915 RepID=A0A3L7JZD1_9BACI|nr:DUF6526 family protein [Falsibacillus albus]RLQ96123.1 hypothetical protein D9X91_07460 [Falsibacillus albus]
MNQQNYENHTRMHPLYHYVLSLLLIGTLIISIVQLVRSISSQMNVLMSVVILLMAIILTIIVVLVRIYPLKAQDRAIRAEENLRHYVLTGELLNGRLTMGQIVALRFADDKEFPQLSKRAAEQSLSSKEIKKEIRQWRADHDRI